MGLSTEDENTEITKYIVLARKILYSEKIYFKNGNIKASEGMRRKRLTVYRKINRICPHDLGYTEPSIHNLGIVKCLRCGNAIDRMTNGFVDGWS